MKSLTDGRSTRWQQHRDARRTDLLRTVRHVVDEHGDDLTMEQISDLSGTTKAVLYRYFTDRAGLQAAMGEWAMNVISRSLDEAATASASDIEPSSGERVESREALDAMIAAFVNLAAGSPHIYRFCDTAVNRFGRAETGGFFNSIAALLAERLCLEGSEGELWAAGAIGFVRAATENWLTDPRAPEDFAAIISDWLWSSLPHTVTHH